MFARKQPAPDPRDAVIEHLLKQNADLLDRLQEMIGQIHVHQVAAHQQKADYDRPHKLYTSEDEDDAMALATRDDGSVDEAYLAELLAQANFDNTSVEIA